MAVNLSPVAGAAQQFFTNSGIPLAGGLLYTYAAGTTTPTATYTDNMGGTPNSNPIVLDSAGRVPNEIWMTSGTSYKLVLKDSTGVTIGTWDNIVASTNATNLLGGAAGQVPWQSAANTTGFVSAGTSGQVFTSGGSGTPTWTSQSALTAGNATKATNIAGGAAGTAVAPGVGTTIGGLAGGALGSAAGSAVQTLGPSFAQELQKTPKDPDGAWERALHTAEISGAFSGASWAAFPIRFFQGPVKQLAFQAFGVQPATVSAPLSCPNYLPSLQGKGACSAASYSRQPTCRR